uniref:Uncharacterized protein n=1 Tax=Solanum tuberosum TaxID=4113 RepID=M1BDH2_SOLTU
MHCCSRPSSDPAQSGRLPFRASLSCFVIEEMLGKSTDSPFWFDPSPDPAHSVDLSHRVSFSCLANAVDPRTVKRFNALYQNMYSLRL